MKLSLPVHSTIIINTGNIWQRRIGKTTASAVLEALRKAIADGCDERKTKEASSS